MGAFHYFIHFTHTIWGRAACLSRKAISSGRITCWRPRGKNSVGRSRIEFLENLGRFTFQCIWRIGTVVWFQPVQLRDPKLRKKPKRQASPQKVVVLADLDPDDCVPCIQRRKEIIQGDEVSGIDVIVIARGALESWRYRKNRNPERSGARVKTHPASVLARSANIFLPTLKPCATGQGIMTSSNPIRRAPQKCLGIDSRRSAAKWAGDRGKTGRSSPGNSFGSIPISSGPPDIPIAPAPGIWLRSSAPWEP